MARSLDMILVIDVENGLSTAISCWRKSSPETISAPAVPANTSKSAVSRKAAFDGVNRDQFFRE